MTPGSETSVLVAEDDAMAFAWLELALEETEFRIAGEARTAAECLDLVRRRPKLVLADNDLPDGRGIELVRSLRLSGYTGHAVLMTAWPVPGFNETAKEAGAQGTLLKSGIRAEVLRTLRLVAGGRLSFDPGHPRRGDLKPPTAREREVLRLIAAGHTNREAARTIGVGNETVKTLLHRTYAKLGVSGRTEAVLVAERLGLL